MGMEDCSETSHFYNVLEIPKSASLSDICESYKSLVMKWHPDRNPTNKAEAEANIRSINEAYRALTSKKKEEMHTCNEDSNNKPKTPSKKRSWKHKNNHHQLKEEELHISSPKLLSRTTSRISPLQSPTFSRSTSRRSTTPPYVDLFSSPASNGCTLTTPTMNDPAFLSKASSSRISTTPIFFSQSAVRRKPNPIEKKLSCTLEELCVGCVKKIKITRDVISTNGLFAQEEEILMINIKPGWKKGTKITFEGKGDERPGTLPADIIFIIDEKSHPIFKRAGDDLELGVEVPLAQALTGCTIQVPLIGGGHMNLSIDDIIYPGYERIIPGQGMPKSKQEGKRGDLRLKFLVEFPSELTDEQRSEIVSILEECS